MILGTRIWAAERPSLDEFLQAQPAWKRDALCREYPHVNFFPTQGEATEPAKSICAMCTVRRECLDYALERDEDGIWGGTVKRQRRTMRKVVSVSGPATHCARGHPYDEENTRVVVRGDGRQTRACRTCAREYQREYLATREAAPA